MLLYFPNPHRGGEPYVKSCRILGTSFSIDDDSEKYPKEVVLDSTTQGRSSYPLIIASV